VGVDLGAGDADVPQGLLDDSQIAYLEQSGGKGMAECVGRHLSLQVFLPETQAELPQPYRRIGLGVVSGQERVILPALVLEVV